MLKQYPEGIVAVVSDSYARRLDVGQVGLSSGKDFESHPPFCPVSSCIGLQDCMIPSAQAKPLSVEFI